MPFIDAMDLLPKEPLPGWVGRFFHSQQMTFSYYQIEPGTPLHRHHHPEEEVWHIVAGELELSLGAETHVLGAGQAAVVPPDVEHSARARTSCFAIVVDHPVRHRVGGVNI